MFCFHGFVDARTKGRNRNGNQTNTCDTRTRRRRLTQSSFATTANKTLQTVYEKGIDLQRGGRRSIANKYIYVCVNWEQDKKPKETMELRVRQEQTATVKLTQTHTHANSRKLTKIQEIIKFPNKLN